MYAYINNTFILSNPIMIYMYHIFIYLNSNYLNSKNSGTKITLYIIIDN